MPRTQPFGGGKFPAFLPQDRGILWQEGEGKMQLVGEAARAAIWGPDHRHRGQNGASQGESG